MSADRTASIESNAAASVSIDEESLLARVDGKATLGAVEAVLAAAGLTLGLDDLHAVRDRTVAAWIEGGAHGARDVWRDPVDHLVAGLEARLPTGTRLDIRPAPRRSVGPDLVALFTGTNRRFGTIDHAWIRIHVAGVPRADTAPFTFEKNPAVSPEEEALLAAIERELRAG